MLFAQGWRMVYSMGLRRLAQCGSWLPPTPPHHCTAKREDCPKGKRELGNRLRKGDKITHSQGVRSWLPPSPCQCLPGAAWEPWTVHLALGCTEGRRGLGSLLAAWERGMPRSSSRPSSISDPSVLPAPMKASAVLEAGRGNQHPPRGSEPLFLKLLGLLPDLGFNSLPIYSMFILPVGLCFLSAPHPRKVFLPAFI